MRRRASWAFSMSPANSARRFTKPGKTKAFIVAPAGPSRHFWQAFPSPQRGAAKRPYTPRSRPTPPSEGIAELAAGTFQYRSCREGSKTGRGQSLGPLVHLLPNAGTHRSLDKDAPVSRPVQRTGIIGSHPILGGLHHHYVRV